MNNDEHINFEKTTLSEEYTHNGIRETVKCITINKTIIIMIVIGIYCVVLLVIIIYYDHLNPCI